MKREIITSAQNPKIKELISLQEKSRVRKEKGLFVVEGRREFEHCLQAGFKVRTVFVCSEIIDSQWIETVLAGSDSLVVDLPAALYQKVAYRSGTEGIVA